MDIRFPRTILTISATLALATAALAPTAALAKGPAWAWTGCDGDCDADQVQDVDRPRSRAQRSLEQVDAGLGRGRRAANTGGYGQGHAAGGNGRYGRSDTPPGGAAARRGWDQDARRGPGDCEDCDAEMGILSEADIDGLVFMANEEKLAHDVYARFATMYELPVFERIAQSEARHQLAVDTVLERYGIEDGTSDLEEGQFSNEDIERLYEELVARGSKSLEEALAVGVLIEETDIADLQERLAGLGGTDASQPLAETAPDVHQMYTNLLNASSHHLEAFQRQQP